MSYSDEVLADTPICYWKLDEASGNFADSSGNGHTAVPVGTAATYQQPALINEGFSILNADLVRADTSGYLLASPNAFTVEAWISISASGQAGGYGIVEMGSGAVALRVDSTGELKLLKSQIAHEVASTITVNDGATHHVVAKANGVGTAKLFIDGVDRTGTVAGSTFVTNTNNTGFGGQWVASASSPNANQYFIGYLDDIAIYDGALSDARILAHYNAGLEAGQPEIMVPLRHVSGFGVW